MLDSSSPLNISTVCSARVPMLPVLALVPQSTRLLSWITSQYGYFHGLPRSMDTQVGWQRCPWQQEDQDHPRHLQLAIRNHITVKTRFSKVDARAGLSRSNQWETSKLWPANSRVAGQCCYIVCRPTHAQHYPWNVDDASRVRKIQILNIYRWGSIQLIIQNLCTNLFSVKITQCA